MSTLFLKKDELFLKRGVPMAFWRAWECDEIHIFKRLQLILKA